MMTLRHSEMVLLMIRTNVHDIDKMVIHGINELAKRDPLLQQHKSFSRKRHRFCLNNKSRKTLENEFRRKTRSDCPAVWRKQVSNNKRLKDIKVESHGDGDGEKEKNLFAFFYSKNKFFYKKF